MRNFTHTDSIKKHVNSGNLKVNLAVLSMLSVLVLVYIFAANAMATTGFEIKRLSMQLSDLEEQHKQLELQNSALQSVSTIKQETVKLNFVPATNITYVKDDNVAIR